MKHHVTSLCIHQWYLYFILSTRAILFPSRPIVSHPLLITHTHHTSIVDNMIALQPPPAQSAVACFTLSTTIHSLLALSTPQASHSYTRHSGSLRPQSSSQASVSAASQPGCLGGVSQPPHTRAPARAVHKHIIQAHARSHAAQSDKPVAAGGRAADNGTCLGCSAHSDSSGSTCASR